MNSESIILIVFVISFCNTDEGDYIQKICTQATINYFHHKNE